MAPAAMLWLEQFPQLCLFARPTNILYNDTSEEKQLLIFTSHGEAVRGELPRGRDEYLEEGLFLIRVPRLYESNSPDVSPIKQGSIWEPETGAERPPATCSHQQLQEEVSLICLSHEKASRHEMEGFLQRAPAPPLGSSSTK